MPLEAAAAAARPTGITVRRRTDNSSADSSTDSSSADYSTDSSSADYSTDSSSADYSDSSSADSGTGKSPTVSEGLAAAVKKRPPRAQAYELGESPDPALEAAKGAVGITGRLFLRRVISSEDMVIP
eukprot:SAG11_NODE_2664_length_3116_cov_4.935366_2_plen_127_part_00